MYRFLLILAVIAMLIGAGILGYAAYVALHPVPSQCQANGTGCGAPALTPKS